MDAMISEVMVNGVGALLGLALGWLVKTVNGFVQSKIKNDTIQAVSSELSEAAIGVVGNLEATTVSRLRDEGGKLAEEVAFRAKNKAVKEVLERVGPERLADLQKYTGVSEEMIKNIAAHNVENAVTWVKKKF